MTPDPEEDPERWVERRTDYLSANKIGLRETVAEAVAWHELGYTSSGVAKKMGVTESTAGKYFDQASDTYPGILMRTHLDFDNDPEAGVDDLPSPPDRECPVCLKDRVYSVFITKKMFPRWRRWGATDILEDADRVCSWCHSASLNGRWVRMEKVRSRARELSESGSKSYNEYAETLKRGISTTSYGQAVAEGVDEEDRDDRSEVGGVEW